MTVDKTKYSIFETTNDKKFWFYMTH